MTRVLSEDVQGDARQALHELVDVVAHCREALIVVANEHSTRS